MNTHELSSPIPFRMDFIKNRKEYYTLCKPKVVALIIFTAIVGMLLSTPGMVPWQPLLFGTLGIGMAAASAAALNQIVDQKADAVMRRTQNRPLPTGNLTNLQAWTFAGFLGITSMMILVLLVNPLTAMLTLLSLIGYAVIYTLYLKRATPQNIVIGGAAGAAPPVLGWVAVTNNIDPNSLLMFLIIFAWTPPHFWALAIHRRDEYAKVDIPMLPVTHGIKFTRLQVLLYTIIMIAVTALPFATRMSSWFYFIGAMVLGGIFLGYAIKLVAGKDDTIAIRTFAYSIIYLMLLFALLLVDHYIPYILGLF